MDSTPAPGRAALNRRILVVDDEAVIRLTIAEFLESEGYAVDTAPNGIEAVQRMRQHRPRAAIVDLMMPVSDGWSLLRSWRADPTLADVPVIVMSARPDAPRAAAAAGASACLVKPFDLDVLLAALDELLRPMPQCSVCGGPSTADRELLVFVSGRVKATWQLCGGCWDLLNAGFCMLRYGESLEAYLKRPGFHITDTEVQTYVRLGLRAVSG